MSYSIGPLRGIVSSLFRKPALSFWLVLLITLAVYFETTIPALGENPIPYGDETWLMDRLSVCISSALGQPDVRVCGPWGLRAISWS